MVDVQQKQNKNAVSVFEAHPEIEDNLIQVATASKHGFKANLIRYDFSTCVCSSYLTAHSD